MEGTTPAVTWPPRMGDYARLRSDGTLGEVVEIAGGDRDRRYTLNLFDPSRGTPVICRLEELEPIWPARTQEPRATSRGEPAPAAGPPWPRWVHA